MERAGNLLAFLQSDDLVSGSVEKLTVGVLKGAVVTWHPSNPHISDLIRRNGTTSKKKCFSIALRHTLVVLEMH